MHFDFRIMKLVDLIANGLCSTLTHTHRFPYNQKKLCIWKSKLLHYRFLFGKSCTYQHTHRGTHARCHTYMHKETFLIEFFRIFSELLWNCVFSRDGLNILQKSKIKLLKKKKKKKAAIILGVFKLNVMLKLNTHATK